jgi:hypothetical protein
MNMTKSKLNTSIPKRRKFTAAAIANLQPKPAISNQKLWNHGASTTIGADNPTLYNQLLEDIGVIPSAEERRAIGC